MLWDDPRPGPSCYQDILMKIVCDCGQVSSESLLSLGALRPILLWSPFFSLCGSVPPTYWTKKITLLACQVQTTSREVAWPYLMSGLCPAPAGGAQEPLGQGHSLDGLCLLASGLCQSQGGVDHLKSLQ